MQVRATATSVRISPRKVRLVLDQVRGLSVEQAERALLFMNKKGAEPVLKLVRSAAANAVHNNKAEKKNLIVQSIFADQGFTIKRFRPRAFGRAGMIRKRTSRLTVVLDEQVTRLPKAKKVKTDVKAETPKPEKKAEKKPEKKTEKNDKQ
ncbi:MAG: 50S ribosomal protein L22 [Candidatus Kerfeldbacteria bacterium]|nr:50S ribosomal protein L22 [Candidatus Kerfeldbacteria bacterium]